MARSGSVSRRQILVSVAGASATALLAACAPAATPATPAPAGAAPTAASPAAQAAPTAAATAAASPTPAVAANVAQLPRNQTLIMGESDAVNQFTDIQLMNPFIPGIARSGWQIAHEPLFYYNMMWTDQVCGPPGEACKGGEIPWQAESYTYNQDYTQVVIKLRDGVTWSDGEPFTANDVVFTLNMLKDHAPKLNFSVEMHTWVKEVVALDLKTAQITLNSPNPRFIATYFAWYSDLGFPIVPEHIFKGQDPTTFTNFDLNKNYPIVTGPWQLKLSSLEQKFWDRRDDWWAAKLGFHKLPAMKRMIILPNFTDEKQLELLGSNAIDAAHGFQQPTTVQVALQRNPKVQCWTANNAPPYGSVDIATATSMSFNCSQPPFNDPDIRRAINHALDRKQILQDGAHGIGATILLPFPRYGALAPFYDATSDIFQKTPMDAYDPQQTATIMQSKGYAKDNGGFWAKDGKRFSIVITLPPPFFEDITPVIVVQLRKAGFDASFKSPSNYGTLVSTGQVDAFLQVPAGGVRDPFLTMNNYHSKWSAPTGQPATQAYRWKNDAYDKLLDQMAITASDDPKVVNLYHSAAEIWVNELPAIPLLQRYLFTPFNTTYWTNWPNEKNPYTVPTTWHRSTGIVVRTLQPATT
jgi:peptide/nickel transport system substrate-binding protein